MSRRIEKLRVLSGISLSWGVLWALLALVVGTIIGLVDPNDIGVGEEPLVLAPMIGLAGIICGVIFSSLLYVFERQNEILQLPLLRVAVWGFVVAVTLPLVMGKGVSEMIVTGPVGALSALASVTLFRTWTRTHSQTPVTP